MRRLRRVKSERKPMLHEPLSRPPEPRPIYRSAPTMLCFAPAKTFKTALEALQHARQACAAFRVGYGVYESLAGRLKHLQTFRPTPKGA
jgi:hypothetical protein